MFFRKNLIRSTVVVATTLITITTGAIIPVENSYANEQQEDLNEAFTIEIPIDNQNLEQTNFLDQNHKLGAKTTTSTSLSTASNTVTCSGSYDYPHASKSSNMKAINAHLTVSCKGRLSNAVRVIVASQMLDSSGRKGKTYTQSKLGSAKVGGDLACTSQVRKYQAIGSVQLIYPAGFNRPVDNFKMASRTLSFSLKNGKCSG